MFSKQIESPAAKETVSDSLIFESETLLRDPFVYELSRLIFLRRKSIQYCIEFLLCVNVVAVYKNVFSLSSIFAGG